MRGPVHIQFFGPGSSTRDANSRDAMVTSQVTIPRHYSQYSLINENFSYCQVNPDHLPESVLSRRGLRRRNINATSLNKVNSNRAVLPNNKRRENLKKCTFSDIRMFGLILTDSIDHTFQDTDVDTDRIEQIRRKRRRRLDTPQTEKFFFVSVYNPAGTYNPARAQ